MRSSLHHVRILFILWRLFELLLNMEPYTQKPRICESSTQGFCTVVCDEHCCDLTHAPPYTWVMTTQFNNYNPNPNCDKCFPSFLVLGVETLMQVCLNQRRWDIFEADFVVELKSILTSTIRNMKNCQNKHPNHAPDFCCHKEFTKFFSDCEATFHGYFLKNDGMFAINISKFYVKTIRLITNCPNDCLQVI